MSLLKMCMSLLVSVSSKSWGEKTFVHSLKIVVSQYRICRDREIFL